MHRLKVQGFVGIKNADIALDGLTVLIGAQASGKSVLARLIYYFNEYFADFDFVKIADNEHKSVYDKTKKEDFCRIFPQYAWEQSEFKIFYANDKHDITVRSDENSGVIELKTSLSVAKHFRSLKSAYRRFETMSDEDGHPIGRFRWGYAFGEFVKAHGLKQYKRALFVPAARSFYATIRDEIFSLLDWDQKIDHMILQFGNFYEGAKKRALRGPVSRGSTHGRRYQRQQEYFESIAKGSFAQEGGQDWLLMKHGRIEMSRASSGQQEAVPLLFAIHDFPRPDRTLIIEEPEAHLFPTAQVKVLEFMVRQLQSRGGDIMFTTHSPYLLSALNNHILADDVEGEEGISRDKVRAYAIRDGATFQLINDETGLISAEYIDSVSDNISDEFARLIEQGPSK